MSKYLNVFNTLEEYQAFSASTEYVQPNVALVKETNVLYYDYGNNQPQADMSDFKVESQEISLGGDKYGKSAITKINYISSGITSLNSAFDGWSSLKEVACEIPSGVTNMGNTFYGCKSLINAPVIPSGITNMDSTFSYCSSLINAPEIPSGVKTLSHIFYGCKNLVNAPSVIPNSVTNVINTFYGCSNIVNAPDIPSGITIMNGTFSYCSSLKDVTLLPTTPPTSYGPLYNCPKLETIYVPDESVDAYKTATGWSQFADKFKPLSSKPSE